MIKSMTGYGQAFLKEDNFQISIEMKSVNHRFLEISIRMPRDLLSLEEVIKKKIGEYVKRGKVDVFITVEKAENISGKLHINWTLAEEYFGAYQQLRERFLFEEPSIRPMELMNLAEVIRIQDVQQDAQQYLTPILQSVESACQQLIHMRQSEGNHLQEDMTKRIQCITSLVDQIQARGPLVIQHFRDRLSNRMKEFLNGQWEVDEGRILTEVAVFAEKANIDEELTRLASHCKQFLSILTSTDAVGRKLDFLVQEMNREANTIGSKANDLEISKLVVDLKAELEKMKEQVQNIE